MKKHDFFSYPIMLRKKAERKSKAYTLLGVIVLGLFAALTLLLSTFEVFDRLFGQGFMVNLAASFVSSIVLFVLLDTNIARRREQNDLDRKYADLVLQGAYFFEDVVHLGEKLERQGDIQERMSERIKSDPMKNFDLSYLNIKMAREQLRVSQTVLLRLDTLIRFADDIYAECLRLDNLKLAGEVQTQLETYHTGRSTIQASYDRLLRNTDQLENNTKRTEEYRKQYPETPKLED